MIHSSSFIIFLYIFRTNTIERVLLTGRGNDIHIAIRAIDPLTSCILLDMIYNSIDHPTNLYHNGAYLAIAHKKNIILFFIRWLLVLLYILLLSYQSIEISSLSNQYSSFQTNCDYS